MAWEVNTEINLKSNRRSQGLDPSARGEGQVALGKRPLERPRHRWEDNIKMALQKVGCGGMDWIELAQDKDRWRALVNVVMNLQVPLNVGNLTSCKRFSFSRRNLLHEVSKLSMYGRH
jgi:hypothetical protein